MEVHTSEETVLVIGSKENFEFRITEDEILEPITDDIPSNVFDIVENRTQYEVDRPDEPDTFEDLRFSGPYDGAEGASVLGYDIDDNRFESLTGLMRYGLNVSVKVMPNGDTYVTEINGESLDEPVEV